MTDKKSVSLLFRSSAILRCVVRRLFTEVSIEYIAGIFKEQAIFLVSPMEKNVGEKHQLFSVTSQKTRILNMKAVDTTDIVN
jgi:hypothetical protein